MDGKEDPARNLAGRLQTGLAGLWENAGVLVVFLLLFGVLSAKVPGFFSAVNMQGVALSVSMVGMVACTMLFCLASGDFDLSIESIVAFSGVIAVLVLNSTGQASLGILAGMAAGALVGLVNGAIIAKLKINALITTLATMQIVRGLGYIASRGQTVSITRKEFFLLGKTPKDVLAWLGWTHPPAALNWLLEIPNPIWITLGCFLLFGFLLNRTTYGRNTLAIGGNKEAARLAGVAVDRIKITIFAVQGLMAGLAGVVLASRMQIADPKTSAGFSLDVISACVLGGVALSGGVGTMLGTVIGVLIMGTVDNAMYLLQVDYFYQYVTRGGILLAAVLFDQAKQQGYFDRLARWLAGVLFKGRRGR